jgi:hypothetical protein
MSITETNLADVADRIDRFGLGAVAREVAEFVDAVRSVGLSPVLVGVLADPAAPEVARQRAFGELSWRYSLSRVEPHRPAASRLVRPAA